MLGFILLKGKDFSVPDGVSTAIIGLFFGLVCGLFFYQKYYRPYYWAFSLGGGFVFTYISHMLFVRAMGADDDIAIRMTLASFVLPFILTLLLNYGLSLMKGRKHKRHSNRKMHSSFFDTVNPGEIFEGNVKPNNFSGVGSSARVGRKRRS